MLKTVILKQKKEKEFLLSLPYIERCKLREVKKKWLDSDLIKVVTGPRRAGKSVFSLMLLRNRPFAYLNFDDEMLLAEGRLNTDDIMQELHATYGEVKVLFFDEIHNIPNWELFLSRLHREGYNIIATGSNASLLSRELATALTGRHIPIEIFPFNFQEFLLAKKIDISENDLKLPEYRGQVQHLLHQYLVSGGYPEIVTKMYEPKPYLEVLFDSLIFKDIVKRHHIRYAEQIDNLGSYLINNIATQYSTRKIVSLLGLKSGVTVEKYLSYLSEAYLLFFLQCLSVKAVQRLKTPKKVYAVDNGLIKAKAIQHSPDTGRLMENLVFTEFCKRSYTPNHTLFYYKTRNNREIDFAIKKAFKVSELLQVSYDTSNLKTEQRELKSMVEAAEELDVQDLTVLTWEQEKTVVKKGATITFKPLLEWLLY